MRKSMISVILLFTLMLTMPMAACAELAWYGAGVLAVPLGGFGDVAGAGFGGAVGAVHPYSEQINLRGQVGYTYFGGKDFGTFSWSYSAIPILALAEYHWESDSPIYALGGVGLTISRYTSEYTLLGNKVEADGSSNEISILGGAGYTVNEQISIEALLTLISDINQLNVQVTYSF